MSDNRHPYEIEKIEDLYIRANFQQAYEAFVKLCRPYPGFHDRAKSILSRYNDFCTEVEKGIISLSDQDILKRKIADSFQNCLSRFREHISMVENLQTENLCIPESYAKHISDCCKYMDIDKLREKGRVIQVNLPEIFIPLYTDFPAWKRRQEDSEFLHSEQRNFDIEDLIAENDYLLIEGEAGSGKTTLLRHFAYMTLCEKNWKNLDGFLPVLIFLKDVRDADFGNIPAGKPLAEKILNHHLSLSDCGIDMEVFRCFCNAGKAVILLDGLDEIAPELRDKVVKSFADFRNSSNCRIVLSGRPHGISGAVVERFGDRHVKILSLNMTQVEEFITRWFRYVYDADSKIGERTANDMIGEIRSNPSIERLVDNPLLLSAICILYHDGKELPNQRAELYKKFVNNLLSRRFSDPENVRYFLMALALEMHLNRTRGIDRLTAIRILETVYPMDNNETKPQYKNRLDLIFDAIEPNSGLLKIEGGEYNFRHLTFQEFFAAIGLVDKETDYAAAIRDFWDDEWYREMILLYIGYLSIENRRWANRIVREILEKEDDKPFYRWRLACWSLLDIHQNTREPQVVELAKNRLLSIFDTDVEPKPRADAGEILGWLGDPRDLEEFVPVTGGTYKATVGKFSIEPFEMSRYPANYFNFTPIRSNKNEQSSSMFDIKPLEISKYPLSNQWYAKFIRDGGYDKREYWTREGMKWLDYAVAKIPRFWHERKWNCPNKPIVGVCWYEAAAFAKWITMTRNDGYIYRLPDENEWEAAAAGFEKRGYAFGNEFSKKRCNVKGSGIRRTSSVGIFKTGNTPEGIADLTGNVWEWTISNYQEDSRNEDFPFDKEIMKLINEIENISGDGKSKLIDEYRSSLKGKDSIIPVLRGGGWGHFAQFCRTAGRAKSTPAYRCDDVGFRIVRLPKDSSAACCLNHDSQD